MPLAKSFLADADYEGERGSAYPAPSSSRTPNFGQYYGRSLLWVTPQDGTAEGGVHEWGLPAVMSPTLERLPASTKTASRSVMTVPSIRARDRAIDSVPLTCRAAL
jgi:hypothetical protein